MMLINEEGGHVLETSAVDTLMRIFGYHRVQPLFKGFCECDMDSCDWV